MNAWHLLLAQRVLRSGGVVAYPTEAVWGLGCHPDSIEGVTRILALKQRPVEQGLILVAADIEQFTDYLADLSPALRARLEANWPGPVTYLVEHGGAAPYWISGGRSTVALRVSDHPLVRALCRACGSPVVSTSANPGGRTPATNALRVRQYFGDGIDLLVPGEIGGRARVSEIRELVTNRVVRQG